MGARGGGFATLVALPSLEMLLQNHSTPNRHQPAEKTPAVQHCIF